jgi:hypothetical protein
MTDKEKLEKIKVLADAMYNAASNITTDASHLKKAMYEYHQFVIQELHKEEPVSNTILLYGLSGSVGIEEVVKETEEYKEWQGDPERQQSFIDFAKFGANYKHKTSKDLEEVATKYAQDKHLPVQTWQAFKAGAQWQKENLWKDAQGNDLPEIDKEVIALIEAFGHYKVIFAHRVDENAEIHTSIDGKPLILHPKKHDKGGWNIPDIKWWLDLELPKIEK